MFSAKGMIIAVASAVNALAAVVTLSGVIAGPRLAHETTDDARILVMHQRAADDFRAPSAVNDTGPQSEHRRKSSEMPSEAVSRAPHVVPDTVLLDGRGKRDSI
jgi:hypothetical protein